ncbi:MAG TPA: DUF4184 family protein [Thermoplasmata archaeon]|uniref:Membrane-bound metal-dependent hydrolase n=1 Tax=uncultured euryarchaeote Rifle_16ft_4_minimus_37789 TaxID=1665195 RepID=A0A0H4T547_9EURY|nr:hypothetical protein [uncultured euryarchaeote Rifle_16ft_4_minimus_37789]HKZ62885.1 DUF4184 family protein [Thermoplasmata archaeon]
MPLTPFHAAIPWIPYVKWPRAFSFWGLTLGAMVSDLEVAPIWALSGDIFQSRGLMHSVLGVLSVNAVITMIATLYIVPPVMRWFDRRGRDFRIFRFAGQDLHADPKDLTTVYASAVLGGLTHILIDIPTHSYNPVFWPAQVGPLNVVPFADQLWWDVVAGVPPLLLFAWMMYALWRR